MPTVNLRAKRIERGWSLSQLAQRCAAEGVPTAVSNLHRIELGGQVPRPGLRLVLTKLLELDVHDFESAAS